MKLNDQYIFSGLAIKKKKKRKAERYKSKRETVINNKDFGNESRRGGRGEDPKTKGK